jgi:uncharacterized surface protein with fasciclin (FAS1) repeats
MNKLTILFLSLAALALHSLNAAQSSYQKRNLVDSAVVPDEDTVQKQKREDYSMIKRVPGAEAKIDEKFNIVDIISSDPSLSTLLQALETTDLIDFLSGSGPLTVFAPNDAAFAKLSPNTLEDLLKPENKEKLVEILKFHIVPGKINSSNLKTMKLKASNGKPLDIRVNGNGVSVNNAKVTKTDIDAANGTIHIIDTVLLP